MLLKSAQLPCQDRSPSRRSGGIAALVCLALLSGCASHRVRYDVPVVALPDRYTKAPSIAELVKSASAQGALSGKVGERSSPLSTVLAEWWTLMGNAELNDLVTRALKNNADLRIAALRVAQNHARVNQASADEVPTVKMPYQAKTFVPEGGLGSVRRFEQVRSRNTYQISVQGDWRADIWGERAAMYESAELQLRRVMLQRDDVQRTLVVSIVSNYAELLSLNDRLRVSRESDVVLSEMLRSVEMRLERGDATTIDVEQQRAAVHAVKATIPVLEQQRVLVLNRLASFAGTIPGELKLTDGGLDSIKFPTVLPGVPSALLLRRPDVRVVEARLLAASADINVARARLLPPLDLTAEVGYGSFFLTKLIQPYSFMGSLAANLAATIFDHGKRAQEVAFNEAVREEMVETYVKVIYDAVREVDDALSSIRLMTRRLDSQQIAVDSSRRAWNSSVELYSVAAVDYLVVLDTERSYHRNLGDWYSARLDKYRGLIDLFGALGGGVPMADELPGEGARPTPLPTESDYGAVVKVASGLNVEQTPVPGITSLEPPIQPLDDSFELLRIESALGRKPVDRATGAGLDLLGEEFWLVEVAGLHDRVALTAVWRDLRHRFAVHLENQTLLPRRQEPPEAGKAGEADKATPPPAGYRLFIARFANTKAANDLCLALQDGQLNCRVVSSRLLKHLDALNAKMSPPAVPSEPSRGGK